MGSETTTLRLPIIDFSKVEFKPDNVEWDLVRVQVQEALQEFGCFEALFDKVPSELRKSIFDAVEELYNLPLETKQKNSSQKLFQGYLGQLPMMPLYEGMAINDANLLEKAESFTNLLWPEGNPGFCKTIQSFSEQLSELDRIIRRMVLESFGVEKYLDEHIESTNYALRVLKYNEPKTTETMLGLKTHTDKNCMTILCENQVHGLEIQTKDGKWMNVKPSPDSFTVLIGDCFYAWTNGWLHAPTHRVMMSGFKARYSVGFQSIPKGGYIIKAPEELVDEDHPILFKPFDYVEFIEFYDTEAGRKAKSALKTYCGV
ncbi:unnamed protein product [Ilex paraguariensis]|uniref:Fe2OG dioxygenase domain-containing protein n=1 Tax=Ilex paraguariensis TaxID=185542 RepID=A0ABC8U0N2_9AQUA